MLLRPKDSFMLLSINVNKRDGGLEVYFLLLILQATSSIIEELKGLYKSSRFYLCRSNNLNSIFIALDMLKKSLGNYWITGFVSLILDAHFDV